MSTIKQQVKPRRISRRSILGAAGSAVGLTTLGSCAKNGRAGGAATEITLEGPNQWTDSGSSFGTAWEKLVARFHEDEPKITLKTVVLPLTRFNETISTQLSAATAPELVFNQASYKPYMVYHLDQDLKKPNPYVPGNKAWIDLYNPKYFTMTQSNVMDAEGHTNFVPFNLFTAGVYYNADAFAKAGVEAPIKTFSDLLKAAKKLKAAGYTPFAMDNGTIGQSWTWVAIANMLLSKYFDEFNVYDAKGKPGKNPSMTQKDWARAVLTNSFTPELPEFVAALQLFKQFNDECTTKNWSGIAGVSGAMANIKDFASGKAAMAWGTDYAPQALPNPGFTYATMPFPTITTESTPLATGEPARFGVTLGGTSYMIPTKTSGDELAAAIKFLQWMSVAEKIQPWLDETGALPAVTAAKAPSTTADIAAGAWGERMILGWNLPSGPPGTAFLSLYDGYLLGSKSLEEEQRYLADMFKKQMVHMVKDNGWGNEKWAKGS